MENNQEEQNSEQNTELTETKKEINKLLVSIIQRANSNNDLLEALESDFKSALKSEDDDTNLTVGQKLKLYEIARKNDTELITTLVSAIISKQKDGENNLNINLNTENRKPSMNAKEKEMTPDELKKANEVYSFLNEVKQTEI